MRVIKFFLKAIVVILILGGGGFLLTREVLLWKAAGDVSNALRRLKLVVGSPVGYYDQCKQKGNSRDSLKKTVFQIRFTSSTEYQIEAVCPQFPSDPIIVDTYTLPRWVTKEAGTSGFVWGEYTSNSVVLAIWDRRQTVYLDNTLVKSRPGSLVLDPGPATECQGWGYECCQDQTAIGVGEPKTGVKDCARTCYSSCRARPLILSFSTDPVPDIKTRVAQAEKNQEVYFSWVVETGESDQITGTLDFGDGQTESFTETNGLTKHTYACARNSCFYQAQVTAVDDQGIESAQTGITGIGIRIE